MSLFLSQSLLQVSHSHLEHCDPVIEHFLLLLKLLDVNRRRLPHFGSNVALHYIPVHFIVTFNNLLILVSRRSFDRLSENVRLPDGWLNLELSFFPVSSDFSLKLIDSSLLFGHPLQQRSVLALQILRELVYIFGDLWLGELYILFRWPPGLGVTIRNNELPVLLLQTTNMIVQIVNLTT